MAHRRITFGNLLLSTLKALWFVMLDIAIAILTNLDGQNRQSPIASVQRTWPTLAGHSAVPRGTNVTPMNANCAIRIAAQQTQRLRVAQ